MHITSNQQIVILLKPFPLSAPLITCQVSLRSCFLDSVNVDLHSEAKAADIALAGVIAKLHPESS